MLLEWLEGEELGQDGEGRCGHGCGGHVIFVLDSMMDVYMMSTRSQKVIG